MKAMVFAAGRGTRLLPLTRKLPKPLLPFRGKTIIEWVLIRLREAGIQQVMINLHYLGDLIVRHLGDGSKLGLEIHYSWEEELLGTGGGLKKVESFFQDRTFLAVNSDIYFEFPLKPSLKHHQTRKAEVTLLLTPRADPNLYGGVSLNAHHQVTAIGPPPFPTNNPTYVFTGVQILEPLVFSYLSLSPSSTIPAYQQMIAQKRRVFGEVVPGRWEDLGTLENYHQLSQIP